MLSCYTYSNFKCCYYMFNPCAFVWYRYTNCISLIFSSNLILTIWMSNIVTKASADNNIKCNKQKTIKFRRCLL